MLVSFFLFFCLISHSFLSIGCDAIVIKKKHNPKNHHPLYNFIPSFEITHKHPFQVLLSQVDGPMCRIVLRLHLMEYLDDFHHRQMLLWISNINEPIQLVLRDHCLLRWLQISNRDRSIVDYRCSSEIRQSTDSCNKIECKSEIWDKNKKAKKPPMRSFYKQILWSVILENHTGYYFYFG